MNEISPLRQCVPLHPTTHPHWTSRTGAPAFKHNRVTCLLSCQNGAVSTATSWDDAGDADMSPNHLQSAVRQCAYTLTKPALKFGAVTVQLLISRHIKQQYVNSSEE